MGNLDIAVTLAINGLSGSSAALDKSMIGFTEFGVPAMILAVALTWWLNGRDRTDRHVAIVCGLSFLLGLAINQVILLLIHRIRPYDAGLTHLLISSSADPSFPSDHATASFAIVFSYLLSRRWVKTLVFFGAAVLEVFSRVYVGTHYASDILGGIGTALIATIFVKLVYRQGNKLDNFLTGIL